MKLLKTLSPLLVCLLFTAFSSGSSFGQHKGHAHPHHNTKAKPHAKAHAVKHHHHVYRKAVHRSKYHPATSVVFTPTWAPHKKYNRRWVYFPKHRCYYDNWRKVYVYNMNGNWTTNPKKPKHIENVNLEEEGVELTEVDDDNDEIYNSLEESSEE
jgi:hypothetical protein